MKKKVLAVLVVLLLVALTSQAAFASPPPDKPDYDGACNMWHSVWTESGPGNAYGVELGDRGMVHVHTSLPHGESIGGANMRSVVAAHCGG